MPVCPKCQTTFSRLRKKENGKHQHHKNRKLCWCCSPYGSLKTPIPIIGAECICKCCHKKFDAFYKKTSSTTCQACKSKIKGIAKKWKCLSYFGFQCNDCGLICSKKTDMGLFDFHHLRDKDFSINEGIDKSWEIVKQELDKCVLLCSLCHRKKHIPVYNEAILQSVDDYLTIMEPKWNSLEKNS